MDPLHNIDALLIGTGEFKFSEGAISAADAQARGWLDFGNIVAFAPEPTTTKEEHQGSYRGVRRADKTVVTENALSYKIRVDEFHKKNVQVLYGASAAAGFSQTSMSAEDGAPLAFQTTAAKIGYWYDLLKVGLTRIFDLTSVTIATTATTTSVGTAADDLITANAHGLTNGQAVKFSGAGIAAPLVVGTVYYVRDVTANTFKVAATVGGAAINLSADSTAQAHQRVYIEGTDYEIDYKLGGIMFKTAQAASLTPTITAPAIVAGAAGSFMGLTPMADPVKQGYGRLIIFDQNDSNKVVLQHIDFSCELTMDSANEIDGTAFTDMTLDAKIGADVGKVWLRDENENAGVA